MSAVKASLQGDGVQNFGYFQARDIYIGTDANKLLTDLRITDPRDDKARILDRKGGLLKDSYSWILGHEDFQKWRNDPRCRFLWIRGDPGKGKTMLLCGIIDHLTETATEACRLAYFFCEAADEHHNNATAVLRGLLFMLVWQYPDLLSYIRDEYNNAGKALFEDSNAWFAMSRILTTMLSDEILDGVVLIVDALDECGHDRQRLLNFISQGSASTRARWIVSSRNWPDIVEGLDRTLDKVTLRLELNDDLIAGAVRAYIRRKVDELAQLKEYDEETRDAVHKHFTEKASNTFLWVALVYEELADPDVLAWETADILLTIPSGLESLYQRMIEHISKSRRAALCKKILAIVSVVYRHISLIELTSMDESLARFAKTPRALESVIASCGSFLALRGDIIHFVHQSAKDFLLDRASDQVLPAGIAYQHHHTFSRSLEVLSKTLRRDIYRLHSPGVFIDDVVPPALDPLAPVQYICTYWVDHLNDAHPLQSPSHGDIQDNGIVHRFLEHKYLYWLEAMSLQRSMSQAVLAMHKLESLMEASGVCGLAYQLARDARLFVLSFKGVIEVAPLQLYASALVFSPTRSLVRTAFKHDIPTWIASPSLGQENWNSCVQTLEYHGRTVWSLSASSDGRRLASGFNNGTIKIWDTASGSCVQTLGDLGTPVLCITILADGRRIASGYRGHNMVVVWDVATGTCVQTLEGHNGEVISVAFISDGQQLISGAADNTIKVWDATKGTCVQTVEIYGGAVASVAFSGDNRYVASGFVDNKAIKVWDLATGECVRTLESHSVLHASATDGRWESLIFSPDGRWLASGSRDNSVRLWEVATGLCLQTLEGHRFSVTSVAYSEDGCQLASGSLDNTVKVWNTATQTCVQTLKGHSRPILSVAFLPGDKQLASGSHDSTIKVWDLTMGAYAQKSEGHIDRVFSVALSADGCQLASGSMDNTVKVWNVETSACIHTLKGHSHWVSSVAFSGMGQKLASGSDDHTIKVWDIETGACIHTLKGHSHRVSSVSFSDGGQQLASGSGDQTIKVWDTATGRCMRTLEVPHSIDLFVAISANGQWLVSTDIHFVRSRPFSTIKAWDVLSGTCMQTLMCRGSKPHSVAISADGRWLASESCDSTVKVREVATGVCVQTCQVGNRVFNLSLDSNPNAGVSAREPSAANALIEADGPIPCYSSLGMSRDGTWILKDSQRLLWLPPEYRPWMEEGGAAVTGSIIAIGCASGRVLVIQFRTGAFDW